MRGWVERCGLAAGDSPSCGGRHELLRGVEDAVGDVLTGSVACEQYEDRFQGDGSVPAGMYRYSHFSALKVSVGDWAVATSR